MIKNTKRASIIGCNGYIGKHLCKFLMDENWDIFGYDTEDHSRIQIKNYTPFNLCEKIQIVKIETNVDFIFFFSGVTGTTRGFYEFDKYIDVNEKGLLYLLDWMRQNGSLARIIFPSTRLVYKGKMNVTLDEESEKEFKTIYSLNKWFGEQVISQYNNCFGIGFNIFRIGVPYGNLYSDDYSYGTVGSFLKKAKANENIVLYGGGEQKRTFTYIEDIVLQIYSTIQMHASENQIFNIGGETYSIKDIAKNIADKFNIKVENSEWPVIDEKLESGDTIFEYSKIQTFTNHQFKESFSTWLGKIS